MTSESRPTSPTPTRRPRDRLRAVPARPGPARRPAPRQAAIVLERAAALEPGKGSILEALGRAYYNTGQHEPAAGDVRGAARDRPVRPLRPLRARPEPEAARPARGGRHASAPGGRARARLELTRRLARLGPRSRWRRDSGPDGGADTSATGDGTAAQAPAAAPSAATRSPALKPVRPYSASARSFAASTVSSIVAGAAVRAARDAPAQQLAAQAPPRHAGQHADERHEPRRSRVPSAQLVLEPWPERRSAGPAHRPRRRGGCPSGSKSGAAWMWAIAGTRAASSASGGPRTTRGESNAARPRGRRRPAGRTRTATSSGNAGGGTSTCGSQLEQPQARPMVGTRAPR